MNCFKLITHLVIIFLFVLLCKVFKTKTDRIEKGSNVIKKVDNKSLKNNPLKNLIKDRRIFINVFLKYFTFHKLFNVARFCLVAIFLIIFFPHNSFAITADEQRQVTQQDLQAKQRIESERRDLIRQKEAGEIVNIGKGKILQAQDLEQNKKADDKICQNIKAFELSGNKEISDFTIKHKFIKPLQTSKSDICFTKLDLSNLHDKIENYYIDQGYIIARVYFDTLEISQGIIKIVIEEGKL